MPRGFPIKGEHGRDMETVLKVEEGTCTRLPQVKKRCMRRELQRLAMAGEVRGKEPSRVRRPCNLGLTLYMIETEKAFSRE